MIGFNIFIDVPSHGLILLYGLFTCDSNTYRLSNIKEIRRVLCCPLKCNHVCATHFEFKHRNVATKWVLVVSSDCNLRLKWYIISHKYDNYKKWNQSLLNELNDTLFQSSNYESWKCVISTEINDFFYVSNKIHSYNAKRFFR